MCWCPGEFGVDASFHTAEWHAARIAALTTERMSWEDWKKKQKDEAQAAEAQVGHLPCKQPISLY
jgi:hypothetical protein